MDPLPFFTFSYLIPIVSFDDLLTVRAIWANIQAGCTELALPPRYSHIYTKKLAQIPFQLRKNLFRSVLSHMFEQY